MTHTIEWFSLRNKLKEWTLSWLDQFVILSRRTFKARCKDYFDKLRLLQAIGIAFLLGLLWWKSSTNTEAQLRDQVTKNLQFITTNICQ